MSLASGALGANALVGGIALGANLPLGMLRRRTRRFSPSWILCVHASIPLIVWLRLHYGLRWWAIPLNILLALAGQAIGGRVRVPAK